MKISLDSPFFEKGDRVGELFFAGFLWLLFSLPIVTIGPASSALYYTTVKVVRRKRDTVWRSFIGAFKSNLKQGILITCLYLAVFLIVLLGFMAGKNVQAGTELSMLAAAGFVVCIPFVLILPWIFPIISRFQAGILKQLQYAVCMALGHLPTTLGLIFLLLCTVFFMYLLPFLLLVLPGIYTWLSSMMIERVMKGYMKKELEKYTDEEDIPWYLE